MRDLRATARTGRTTGRPGRSGTAFRLVADAPLAVPGTRLPLPGIGVGARCRRRTTGTFEANGALRTGRSARIPIVEMRIDPADPVVALCAEGMQAEARHQFERARERYQRAWDEHRTDSEAAIAAHFLPRHQPGLEAGLCWNERALRHALAAPAHQVETFFASLSLDLAHSLEMLERADEARSYLVLGEAALGALPEFPYAAVVRDGLSRMRRRLATSSRAGTSAARGVGPGAGPPS